MGAITDYDEYLQLLRENRGANFQQSAAAGRVTRLNALYRTFVPAPVVPTTSVALNDTSDIAIGPLPDVSGSAQRLTLLGARANPAGISGQCLIVADILNHSGGISGSISTQQTTNLPTAPLTRYTDGEGVMAGLVIYTALGTTGTTFTVSYTNQNGVSGSISTATGIGGAATTGLNTVGGLLLIPLASGDSGVRSVESVTFAGTTGTVGNAGIILFKPLAMIALNQFEGAHVVDGVSTGGFVGALAQAEPNACISLLGISNVGQANTGTILLGAV